MYRTIVIFQAFLILVMLSSCTSPSDQYSAKITNTLERQRSTETVEISKSDLGGMLCEKFSRLGVKDAKTGEYLPSQVIDTDMNGELNILIFQPSWKPAKPGNISLFHRRSPSITQIWKIALSVVSYLREQMTMPGRMTGLHSAPTVPLPKRWSKTTLREVPYQAVLIAGSNELTIP